MTFGKSMMATLAMVGIFGGAILLWNGWLLSGLLMLAIGGINLSWYEDPNEDFTLDEFQDKIGKGGPKK